jgi:GH15 family glucan-1,4-alpha-glucosidase
MTTLSRNHPPPDIDAGLLEECHVRSIELLLRNSVPEGIMAATRTKKASERHYAAIFGRDAAICALGMAVSGEPGLVESARAGLRTLARHQAHNGQIPKYVKPELGETDFWYSGCIDATLWWLIALHRLGMAEELRGEAERAIRWLLCQEHQVWRLLQQNEASDWADIMPRSGFVLYTNALWHLVKRLWSLENGAETRDYADFLFHPYGNAVPAHRRARLLAHYVRNHSKKGDLYLSFLNFSFWGEEGDTFGNILAALVGIADTSRSTKIVQAILRAGGDRPYPLRAVLKPLEPGENSWRRYMERHRQNLPYRYHNGGIWPFIGGFFSILLARLGMREKGWEVLSGTAEAARLNGWEFNEWLHGETGEPLGMPGQSWNAALFLLAYDVLRTGKQPW